MTNQNNAAQPERDPIHEAIDILTVASDELRNAHTVNPDDWTGEPEAKAEYDRTLRVVAALSNLHTLTPTSDSTLQLENELSDDEIEALAIKHIAPGAKQFRAVFPDLPPYQQTAQFRRVKALIGDLLSKLRVPVAGEAQSGSWPEKPTDAMLEALRTGSRKDWPSNELCRVRYAALRAAVMAAQPGAQKEQNDA